MTINPALSPERSTSKFYYGYVVFAAAFFTKLLMWGSNYCFGIFFKLLLAEFGWSRAITSGAFSLAIIGGATFVTTIVLGMSVDQFGCGIGPLLAGHLFDLTGSYIAAFIMLAALSVLSALLSLVLAQVHNRYPYR